MIEAPGLRFAIPFLTPLCRYCDGDMSLWPGHGMRLRCEDCEAVYHLRREEWFGPRSERTPDEPERACPKCGEPADHFIQGNPVYATAKPCGCEFVPDQ